MNDVLIEANLTPIDNSWVMVPVGGAGKLSTFVSLIGANQLSLAVLMDSSTKDADAVKRLASGGRLKKGSLIEMSEITGNANSDIEDLFDPEFYLELVNRAYAGPLAGTPIRWRTLVLAIASRDGSPAYSHSGESTTAGSITIDPPGYFSDSRESSFLRSTTQQNGDSSSWLSASTQSPREPPLRP